MRSTIGLSAGENRRRALSGEAKSAPTFTLDRREGVVIGTGGTVRLEPKVMEVLVVLSSHPGHVVSRNELMDKVWPGVIVTEHTLTRCIYQLRRDLRAIIGQEGAADFDPIETLPKRGYRLRVSVKETPAADVPQQLPRAPTLPVISSIRKMEVFWPTWPWCGFTNQAG